MWFPVILFHLLLFLLLLIIEIPSAALVDGMLCVCVEERAWNASFWPLLHGVSDIVVRIVHSFPPSPCSQGIMVWRLPPVVSSFRLTLTHYDWLVAFRLLMCKSTRENKQLEIGMLKSTCYLLPSALLSVCKSQCLFGLVKSQFFVASPGPQISSSLHLLRLLSQSMMILFPVGARQCILVILKARLMKYEIDGDSFWIPWWFHLVWLYIMISSFLNEDFWKFDCTW